jgi:hypothetical protein
LEAQRYRNAAKMPLIMTPNVIVLRTSAPVIPFIDMMTLNGIAEKIE